MTTCRQVTSDIVGALRGLGIDDRIPVRLVLSMLKGAVQVLLKQDLDSRRVLKITDIWKTIPCLHLCKIDPMECGDIPHCNFVMKSEEAVPKAFESSYGDMLKVLTIDGNKEYKQIHLFEYKDIKNREYQDPNQRYFWLIDKHIYIPDSEVKEVMVVGLFENPHEVTKLVEGTECLYALDEKFPSPEYLLSVAQDLVIKQLAEIYKRTIPDSKPNNNPNDKS